MLKTKRFWVALILTACFALSLIPCGLVALADSNKASTSKIDPAIQGVMTSGKTGAFAVANGVATPLKIGDVIAQGIVNRNGTITVPKTNINFVGNARTDVSGQIGCKIMPDGKVVVTEITAEYATKAPDAGIADSTQAATYSIKSYGWVKDGSGNTKTMTQAGMIYLDSGTSVYSGVPNYGFTRNSPFVLVASYHPSDGTGPDIVGETSRGIYRATISGITYQHDCINHVLATPGGYWNTGAEFSGNFPAGYYFYETHQGNAPHYQ